MFAYTNINNAKRRRLKHFSTAKESTHNSIRANQQHYMRLVLPAELYKKVHKANEGGIKNDLMIKMHIATDY